MNWLKKIFSSNKKEKNRHQPQPQAKQEVQSLVTETLEKTDAVLNELDALMNKLDNLSPEELARAEWFRNLSELDKKLVTVCDNKGVKITPGNFEEMKKIMLRHAKDK